MNRFHHGFYKTLRVLIMPFFSTFGRYSWKAYRPKSKNCLILTNHNTNVDFFLCGLSFPEHMYYVASEHVYHLGFVSKIIRLLAEPIPRRKGGDSRETQELILRRLAEGENVCIFVEGNRSFSGETGWISGTNGMLARKSGAGLITYRIHGAYMTDPRWSHKHRRGRIWGEVVHEYTPEELSSMTDEEVTACIRRDVYVNAYEDQAKHHYRYRSSAPAEDLQTALFLCPVCGTTNGMRSLKDRFWCSCCGLSVKMNEHGYLEWENGEEPLFTTVLDWFRFQKEKMRNDLPQTPADTVIFRDADLCLKEQDTGAVDTGSLTLYRDKLVFSGTGTMELPLSSVSGISVLKRDTLFIAAGEKYYRVSSAAPYCAVKYLMGWRYLTGRDYV